MQFKQICFKRILNLDGYILITTSGIMFFIISFVTIIHLISGSILTQQYRLSDSYQEMMDHKNIQSIIAMQVSNDSSSISLPSSLNSKYSFSYNERSNNSVDFYITTIENGRISSFNIEESLTQASSVDVDLSSLTTQSNVISGIRILSTDVTDLVSLRAVWYPSYASEVVSFYSIGDGENDYVFTANVSESNEFTLPFQVSGTEKNLTIYFSSILVNRVLSIYLEYSDASIKDILLEI